MSDNPEFHQCGTCGYEWKHGVHGGHSCADTLSARLASQQVEAERAAESRYWEGHAAGRAENIKERTYAEEQLASQHAAHDAEIARLKIDNADLHANLAESNTWLAEANAACAMKDEALKAVANIYQNKRDGVCGWLDKVRGAISASPQQVSEWERKQLEPLRAQVAAFLQAARIIDDSAEEVEGADGFMAFEVSEYAINQMREVAENTKATAEQFIAECEQRGAVKALEEAANWFNAPEQDAWEVAEELRRMAAELPATSKKAG